MIYVCPTTRTALKPTEDGLLRDDGRLYPWLGLGAAGNPIPNFLDQDSLGSKGTRSLDAYHSPQAEEMYRNFLDWLFATARTSEEAFRAELVSRLDIGVGSRVLVTGCGLGDDFAAVLQRVGEEGTLYAQDLSPSMVAAAQRDLERQGRAENVFLSVGNAGALPFPDGSFDAALHFGGLNLFDEPGRAISEMDRVVRSGGKVVFGDEGVAPWLRATEYGKVAITNNPLWASEAPLPLIPERALDVKVSWVLGNCFYIVEFTKSDIGPELDWDVPHKGRRGGTMRSRYFGQMEGVTAQTRAAAAAAAAEAGVSLHDWLEQAVQAALGRP